MVKKKIAILLPWMKMGGTNKIALSFIKELEQYCDITLILSQKTGELLSEISPNTHLVLDHMLSYRELLYKDLKRLHLHYIVKDILYYLKIKLKKNNIDNYKYFACRNGVICETEFDCAISYHGQSPERLINLLYRLQSKLKVAWIHGEFNNSPDHCRKMAFYYNKLDHLFFVSKATLDAFREKIPSTNKNLTVYYNPINSKKILSCAHSFYTPKFSNDFKNIVTVGRVSKEKGQIMIPAITRQLIDSGQKIRWYIIGNGDTVPEVMREVQKYSVEDSVIFLGTQINPYPFIKDCDIYVQPSFTEGYSTTICEAAILGKAIIGTTPSGGIFEQISNGEDGLIVDATVDSLSNAILSLLQNTELRRKFEIRIKQKNFEGKNEINKILSIL